MTTQQKLKLRFVDDVKQPFESSSGLTPQFLRFCNAFRRDFKAYLEVKFGATDIDIHRGHFELSGFFTQTFFTQTLPPTNNPSDPKGQVWYFSTGDVRWATKSLGLLVRTAKSYKDYTGGHNNKVRLDTQELFEADMHDVLKIHTDNDGCDSES